jgi:hypothetical protein
VTEHLNSIHKTLSNCRTAKVEKKRTGVVAQVKHLLSKHKALSSSPNIAKKKKKKRERERDINWYNLGSQWLMPVILATWEAKI